METEESRERNRILFDEQYRNERIEQEKRRMLGAKEFRFAYFKETGVSPYDPSLNLLYEDYTKRVLEYRKVKGNDAPLDVPLIVK